MLTQQIEIAVGPVLLAARQIDQVGGVLGRQERAVGAASGGQRRQGAHQLTGDAECRMGGRDDPEQLVLDPRLERLERDRGRVAVIRFRRPDQGGKGVVQPSLVDLRVGLTEIPAETRGAVQESLCRQILDKLFERAMGKLAQFQTTRQVERQQKHRIAEGVLGRSLGQRSQLIGQLARQQCGVRPGIGGELRNLGIWDGPLRQPSTGGVGHRIGLSGTSRFRHLCRRSAFAAAGRLGHIRHGRLLPSGLSGPLVSD